ncbi:MAG: DinB family protein [Chloroflexota bacterium]|nr:DinB family protein [Chloroflexota bacterium]
MGSGVGVTTGTGTSHHAPDEIVAALAAMPGQIDRSLNGQPDEALVRPARDGGWGVVEIMPHLRDWEEIFLQRVRAILTEDRPFLESYDDELWVIERDYRGQDTASTLDQFRQVREELVEMLRDLPAEAWHRTAEHEVHGPITLLWLAGQIASHDAEHREQVRDALA